MNRLGVITGLATEADCLSVFPAAERPSVRCAGADVARAREAAGSLISEGCAGLLSFGMAGGLDGALGAGTVVIADSVVAPDGRRFATRAAWREGLRDVVGGAEAATIAPLAGSDRIVATVQAKRNLREATGAAAVDMESHGVAEVAAEAGVPFLALRAVADPGDREVPAWVMSVVADDGRVRPSLVTAGLLARPWTLGALIGLARESRKARASLRRVALVAGPGFGFR